MERVLDISQSQKFLEKYKIPFVKSYLAKNSDAAVIAANNIGYPVTLKVVSKQVVHKTDIGGVILGIQNDDELQKAFAKIISNIKQKVRGARIDGIMVQRFVNGVEVIVGGKLDPTFGQTILFGLGGIFVELIEDVSLRIVPINKIDAGEMISEIKAYKIFSGFRGKKVDKEAVEEILLRVSKLLEDNTKITELDINPLIVLQKGAVAVDARIVIGE